MSVCDETCHFELFSPSSTSAALSSVPVRGDARRRPPLPEHSRSTAFIPFCSIANSVFLQLTGRYSSRKLRQEKRTYISTGSTLCSASPRSGPYGAQGRTVASVLEASAPCLKMDFAPWNQEVHAIVLGLVAVVGVTAIRMVPTVLLLLLMLPLSPISPRFPSTSGVTRRSQITP